MSRICQVTNNVKRSLILMGVVLAVGTTIFWWRSSPDGAPAAGFAESATTNGPPTLPVSAPARIEPQEAHHSEAAAVDQSAPANNERTLSTAGTLQTQAPMQLPAEAGVVIDDGQEFKGIRDVGSDEDFVQRMERLSEQSLQDRLAIDLTALSSSAAAETSRQIIGVEVKRIACGLQVCMVALSAPSVEVFSKWTTRFFSNQPVSSHAVSSDSATLRDGSTEYRLLFSTDDSVRRVEFRPRK